MDDEEYRRLCAAPDVLRRSVVRATYFRMRDRAPHLAAELERLLESSPVPKPVEHEGGVESDYLWLDVHPDTLEAVEEELHDQETDLAQDPAADSATLRWVAHLADLWTKAESSRSDAV